MLDEDFHKQYTEPYLTKETPPPPLPTSIGPYKVEALLHKGGMSWVYMASHPENSGPVVIKILPAPFAKDEDAVRRFLQESHLIATADHLNIVKLYGEGEWEGGFYIAMEWIPGTSLRKLLETQPLSTKRALRITLQIGQALQHLHSLGIIHRDLKPENILITQEDIVKVIDLGIAQTIQIEPLSLGKNPSISGTPYYMSPEQKSQSHKVSPVSDIYSLAVIAYELLLGKLCYGVIQVDLLPKHLRKILRKALAVSPEERYESIDPFLLDLSSYLSSKEIEKEKPKQDSMKEMVELLQVSTQMLSIPKSPVRKDMTIGLATARSTSIETNGLYYDIFCLSGGGCVFVIGESHAKDLSGLFHTAVLRGMMHNQMGELESSSFSLHSFFTPLQRQLSQDPLLTHVALSALFVQPSEGKFHFMGGNISSLPLESTGRKWKVLYHDQKLEGEAPKETIFLEKTEAWSSGDILLYHSLAAQPKWIEGHATNLGKNGFFAQSFADAFMEKARFPLKTPAVLFAIQRT